MIWLKFNQKIGDCLFPKVHSAKISHLVKRVKTIVRWRLWTQYPDFYEMRHFWQFSTTKNQSFKYVIAFKINASLCIKIDFIYWSTSKINATQTFFLATSFYNRSLWNCVCDLLTEICFNWDIFRVEQGKNQEGEGRKEKDCCAACNKTVIATKMCPWKKVVKLYTPRPSPVNCQPMVLNKKGQNDTKIFTF